MMEIWPLCVFYVQYILEKSDVFVFRLFFASLIERKFEWQISQRLRVRHDLSAKSVSILSRQQFLHLGSTFLRYLYFLFRISGVSTPVS